MLTGRPRGYRGRHTTTCRPIARSGGVEEITQQLPVVQVAVVPADRAAQRSVAQRAALAEVLLELASVRGRHAASEVPVDAPATIANMPTCSQESIRVHRTPGGVA